MSTPAAEPGSVLAPTLLVVVGLVFWVLAAVLALGAFELSALAPYIQADATARLFLFVIDTIFLGIAVHNWGRTPTDVHGMGSPRRYVVLASLFLIASNAAILSDQFLPTWIGLEATTLAAAPLILRAGAPASIQASFRYFLFSSVGLGIALLGLLCLEHPSVSGAPWQSVGLGLVILGYGTKLGLAPMYMWLPETYDEAPPPVTSMLAAIQFNVALVALIRVLQEYRVGNDQLVSNILLGMGLASVALATASLIATTRLRRLIGYASIVHGGVIAIGLGVGSGAAYGVLLYAVSNAFIKAMLFLTAGKLEAAFDTRETEQIRGVIKTMPFSGLFLMTGTFALLGFPPFGSFVGELLILSGLVRSGYLMTFATLGFLVSVTFVATGRTVFPMIWGQPQHPTPRIVRQSFVGFLPKLVFLVLLVILGLHLPDPINALFREVAVSLGDK